MALTQGPLGWAWHLVVVLVAGALALAVGSAADSAVVVGVVGATASVGLWLVLRARLAKPVVTDGEELLSTGETTALHTVGIGAVAAFYVTGLGVLEAIGVRGPGDAELVLPAALAVPVLVDATAGLGVRLTERAREREAAFTRSVDETRVVVLADRVVVGWARRRVGAQLTLMVVVALATAFGGALEGGVAAVVCGLAALVVLGAVVRVLIWFLRLPGPLVLDADGLLVLGHRVSWRRVVLVHAERVRGTRHLLLLCDRVPAALRRRAQGYGGEIGLPLAWCDGRPDELVALVRAYDGR